MFEQYFEIINEKLREGSLEDCSIYCLGIYLGELELDQNLVGLVLVAL